MKGRENVSAGRFICRSRGSDMDVDAFDEETIKNSHAVRVVHCQNQWAANNGSTNTIQQYSNNTVPIYSHTDGSFLYPPPTVHTRMCLDSFTISFFGVSSVFVQQSTFDSG